MTSFSDRRSVPAGGRRFERIAWEKDEQRERTAEARQPVDFRNTKGKVVSSGRQQQF
jgi:hypothetical protein